MPVSRGSSPSLTDMIGKLAAAPAYQRVHPQATSAARSIVGRAMAAASPAARQRFQRSLELAGLVGKNPDQFPQTPWPAFDPAVPGGPPRLADLLAPAARMSLARQGLAVARKNTITPQKIEPDVIEKEAGLETQNYRAAMQEKWQALITSRETYRAQAAKHGADPGAAIAASNKAIRGDVRIVIFEILSHVPADAAMAFLEQAPPTWGLETEVLLDEVHLVPNLIKQAYPHAQWAKDMNALTRAVAEDDASWKAYALAAMSSLGGAATTAAAGAFEVTKDVGGGLGDLLSGGGDLLRETGKGIGMVPIAIGVAAVGAAVVAVVWHSSAQSPAPAQGAT